MDVITHVILAQSDKSGPVFLIIIAHSAAAGSALFLTGISGISHIVRSLGDTRICQGTIKAGMSEQSKQSILRGKKEVILRKVN